MGRLQNGVSIRAVKHLRMACVSGLIGRHLRFLLNEWGKESVRHQPTAFRVQRSTAKENPPCGTYGRKAPVAGADVGRIPHLVADMDDISSAVRHHHAGACDETLRGNDTWRLRLLLKT